MSDFNEKGNSVETEKLYEANGAAPAAKSAEAGTAARATASAEDATAAEAVTAAAETAQQVESGLLSETNQATESVQQAGSGDSVGPEGNGKKIRIIDFKLILTSLICIAPMIFGMIVWDRLPETMPIHFDINGNPDSWGDKRADVFLQPVLCLVLNIVLHVTFNLGCRSKKERLRLAEAFKWFAPLLSVFVSAVIYLNAFEIEMNVRMWTSVFIGLLFLVIGNYFPKTSVSMVNIPVDEEAFTRWKQIAGWVYVALGLAVIATAFFSFGGYVLVVAAPLFVVNTLLFVIKVKKD